MSAADQHSEARSLWNEAAATFDDAPDHGLRDPAVREQWTALLKRLLPSPPAAVLDVGCGTGSLGVLLAGMGHRVTGVDFSSQMVGLARRKAADAGVPVDFHIQDAAEPDFPPGSFAAVICRHVLWALPDPAAVLRRWTTLLAPGGTLVLIEGFWHTGAGLHANQVVEALPPGIVNVCSEDLSRDPLLWSGPVKDERFVVRAMLPVGA
jgi:2-polyprenyl-3-methyl-5-hydroxy-6-metoxy-1,4-benzoquinol methylase